MSNLPKVGNWADSFPLVEPNPQSPIRAAASGVGDEFVIKVVPQGNPGASGMFLTQDGTWRPVVNTTALPWGSMFGTLSDQTDLWAQLQARPTSASLAKVATTGAYADLTGKPVFGDLAFINKSGLTSQFLRGDGTWQIPVDVNAQWGNISGSIAAQTDLQAALSALAPLNSPTFTGNVTVPATVADDNSTRVPNTAWYFGQAYNALPLMDGVASSGASPRWARGDHRHPTDNTLAPLASPAFTGLPTAPTAVPGNNSQLLATTAFVAGSPGSGKFPDGSVGAPSIAFANEPALGIYRDGAGILSIGIGGTNRVSVSATGINLNGNFSAGGNITSIPASGAATISASAVAGSAAQLNLMGNASGHPFALYQDGSSANRILASNNSGLFFHTGLSGGQVMWFTGDGVTGGCNIAVATTHTNSVTLTYASPAFWLNKTASGQVNSLVGGMGGVLRWVFEIGNTSPESGANAGSDFNLNCYGDTGTYITTPMSIPRKTGIVSIKTSLAAIRLSDVDGVETGTMQDFIDVLVARVAALEAKTP